MLDSDRFVDTTVTEVFATLLDEAACLASISTHYRILRADNHRRWSCPNLTRCE
ncbi:hypothetical protein [Micromonospora purpureochromogenes]|uniref:hypothetical protein n=1 Tax=Micromonospora purpureochromogenes TaxID=47872 RepID=UPI003F4D13F8